MAKINAYLSFKGNCEEAFNFYKSVFGGEFSFFGRFDSMPAEYPIADSERNKIMHVTLPIGDTVLQGSDSADNMGPEFVKGTNFSISITAESEEEADRLFNALAAGGNINMPLQKTFWGSYFGTLSDQFGVQWMMSFGGAGA